MLNKDCWGYSYNGFKFVDKEASAYGEKYSDGDQIKVEVNVEEGWIEFSKNGQKQGKIEVELKEKQPLFFGLKTRFKGESWKDIQN